MEVETLFIMVVILAISACVLSIFCNVHIFRTMNLFGKAHQYYEEAHLKIDEFLKSFNLHIAKVEEVKPEPEEVVKK